MRASRFSGVVFGALALVLLAFPLFSPEGADRLPRPASPHFDPPLDPIPPNLIRAGISEEQKELTGLVKYPGNSYENNYRGVVSANVHSLTDRDELIVDFGSNGVWVYAGLIGAGTWYQISGVNPSWIFSVKWGDAGDEEIIGDFGSFGLWTWDYSGYPGVWTQLSGVNPEQGFAVDDDGDGNDEIEIDFGSLGLWRYDLDTGVWMQFSAINPLVGGIRTDMWNPGSEEGIWSFAGYGVWSFHSNATGSGSYIWQLSGTDPSHPNVSAEFGIGDAAEELVMSFGSTLGTWLAQGSSYPAVIWDQISTYYLYGVKEVRVVGATDYELLVDFANNAGFWYWNYSGFPGTWTKLNDNDPGDGFFEPFDPNYLGETNGDEEVAVDFDALGLYLYDFTTGGFTMLSSSDPVYMVKTDIYGDAYEGLIVDFGTAGLWGYNGWSNEWHQLSSLSPD